MLEELKKYENLGTPTYFWTFLNQLKKGDLWTEEDILSYFYNKSIDNRSIFDGCIPLLKFSKIISIHEETKEIIIDFQYKNIIYNEKICKEKLLEGFLLAFSKDKIFYNIFSGENISYDISFKAIEVKKSAFGLKYANIRKLFLDFNFLIKHPNFPENKFIINPLWKKYFDNIFLSEIRKRKIGIDELKQNLEKQQVNGEIAEKFVLKYENNRLGNMDGIQWISPFDVEAGYDVLSFDNIKSIENDRFIEVKSYSGDKSYFYWTKNEMNTAKIHGNKYFLYLINRDRINNKEYHPEIIKNPIENVLNNSEWIKEVDKYYISLKENF